MAILKFRVYFEEDDSVYRDIAVHHKQSFLELHNTILTSFEFDNKHEATFYRSNDNWQKGKQITFEVYPIDYVAEPLLMKDTTIGSQIFDPTQKFLYEYDFKKGWSFLIELINVSKEASDQSLYPIVIRKEGIPPSQYGTKGIMGTNKLSDVEEKYDLTSLMEGFGTKDDEGGDIAEEDMLGLSAEEGETEAEAENDGAVEES
jgi:Plasmid pRiA4b ORF-3-like protein